MSDPSARSIVLVVDDDATRRALARASLTDDGYEIVLADSGEDAASAFARVQPQCILIHASPAGVDGIATCAALRASPGGANAAIVYASTLAEVGTFERAVGAGVDDFVTLPYRPTELSVRVRNALRLRRVARERDELHDGIRRQRDELQRFELEMRDANQKLVLATVHADELTDVANAACESAADSEERFRTLVTTSSALVWHAAADGTVEIDRDAWAQFTGDVEGVAGAGWERSVHPADLDRVRAAWAGAVATGSIYQCQLRLQRRTGGYAWVLARAAPISRSGRVREWIGMLTDITDRVRVDEARERFIGILGHDLRSPLAAIQMGVEILADLPKTDATILERVGRSAKRMEAMIRDLLDFTRGQLGDGIPVSPRPCDLGRLATDVLAEIQQANPARVMGLRRTGDLRGQWDPDRIEQVLSNLLGNAVAHGTGPIDLAVRDSGETVVMTVHSEGAPIPKPKLATLFEPFSGVAAGSSGLGLGLFIASEIVRAHQGTLAVSSAAGEGTTFTIRWPRRQTSDVPAVLPD